MATGLGTGQDHALTSLLALNGLRISEALGADVTAMGSERGHRTLTVLRKGGKIVTIPGRRVRYVTTAQLVNELVEAADEGTAARMGDT